MAKKTVKAAAAATDSPGSHGPYQVRQESFELIPVDTITPSPLNPRKTFGKAELEELGGSIRVHGVVEPLVVRPANARRRLEIGAPAEVEWELVAGERRWRAAKLVGLPTVPAVRVDVDDNTALELMLVENLQRRDIDPLEEAQAYQKLINLGWTQHKIAERTSRAQPTIANALRLLRLPESVQERVSQRKLSAGHAKALVRFAEHPEVASRLAEIAIAKEAPVRTLEARQVPYAWELAQAGAIRVLGWETPFRWEMICPECPFNAFRQDEGADQAYCLFPPHYEELAQQARAEAEARAENLALLRPEREEPAPIELIQVKPNGGAAAIAGHLFQLWTEVQSRLEADSPERDPRALALIAIRIISTVQPEAVAAAVETLGLDLNPAVIAGRGQGARGAAWEALAHVPSHQLVRLMLECVLQEEFRYAQQPSGEHRPDFLSWYLGRPLMDSQGRPLCRRCFLSRSEAVRYNATFVQEDLCSRCAGPEDDEPATEGLKALL